MSEPFLAEIRMVGFNFAPRGWALCDGQILPISQNQSLYSLLGTTYGGDGSTWFALPDLRGRTPIHVDAAHRLGANGGVENLALSEAAMPAHGHAYRATCAGATANSPANMKLAPTERRSYLAGGPHVGLHAAAVGNVGSGQAHNNMQPYLALHFVIALAGLFPSPD